jgi:hypothetical protein
MVPRLLVLEIMLLNMTETYKLFTECQYRLVTAILEEWERLCWKEKLQNMTISFGMYAYSSVLF